MVHHMDVKTAFLNGIYMSVPKGLNHSYENKVCKLNKAIYGLKQAARCWFEVLESVLKDVGFKNLGVDRCIYILDKGDIKRNIYILLYVDDVVIATNKADTMSNFKSYLHDKFKMTDLREIRHFIGIKIDRTNGEICLSQSAYIKNVLRKFNMEECNSVSTPLPSKLDYTALQSEESCDAPCRNLMVV